MKKSITTLIAVLAIFCANITASATVIDVFPGLNAIQNGIDQTTQDGDTVLVHSGVYAEELAFPVHDIVVLSVGDDVTFSGSMYFMNGSTASTMIDGFNTHSMYVRAQGASGVTFQNNTFTDNPPMFIGGNSDVVALHNMFRDCANGVFFAYATASQNWGSLTVRGCEFVDNGLNNEPITMLDENGEEIIFADRQQNFGAVVHNPLGGGDIVFEGNLCLSNEVNYIGNLIYAGAPANTDSVIVNFNGNTVVGQRNYYSETATLLFAASNSKNRLEVHNNLFVGNDGTSCYSGNVHSSHNVAWSDDQEIAGVLVADPKFCDPSAGDYHVADDSPCLPENNSWNEPIGAYGAGQCAGVGVNTPINQPMAFSLLAYPNPFNPSTTINFQLPSASQISLIIYDLSGQVVKTLLANEYLPSGQHEVSFNADHLSSGTYFCRLTSNGQVYTSKLLLLK